MTETSYEGLTQLGTEATLPASPEAAVLETVPNLHPGTLYLVRFTCPEFTSLCPITGQPDFAHLVIDYVPKDLLVESKSLKLYLGSFRNHGAFHEACTLDIAKRLEQVLAPRLLVSARRHADRRVPSDRRAARGSLAPRSRCDSLPRPRMNRRHGFGSRAEGPRDLVFLTSYPK
jgi:7-cyano-7-deazaguanine reductase